MSLYVMLGALGVILGALGWAFVAGRRWTRATQAEDTANAARRVADAVAAAPGDRADLVDRLRRGGGL